MLSRVRSSWPVLGAWSLVAAVSVGYAALCCAVFWALSLPWWWGLVPVAVSLLAAELLHLRPRIGAAPSGDTFVIEPDDSPRLHGVVDRLCALTGLDKPILRLYDARAANAVTFTPPGEADTVYVSTGLLEQLDNRELEAVLAHELAHLNHRDQRVLAFAGSMTSTEWMMVLPAGTFMACGWADTRLCALARRCGRRWTTAMGGPPADRALDERVPERVFSPGLSAVLIVVVGLARAALLLTAFFVLIPAVIAGVLLFAATYVPGHVTLLCLVRRRELAADRAAAELTGAPATLAAALGRMTGSVPSSSQPDLRAFARISSLAILPLSRPRRRKPRTRGDTGGRAGRTPAAIWDRLRSTHPAVEVRIFRLQKLSARMARRDLP